MRWPFLIITSLILHTIPRSGIHLFATNRPSFKPTFRSHRLGVALLLSLPVFVAQNAQAFTTLMNANISTALHSQLNISDADTAGGQISAPDIASPKSQVPPQDQSLPAITTLSLAAENSWPPFADKLGNGISHRLIKAAFSQMNIEVTSVAVPYSRALMMAEKGSVDGVFNVTREASTEQRFVFGNTPLFIANASFYQMKNAKNTVKSKWDLPKGSLIGVINGFEYGDEFPTLVKQQQLKLLQVSTQEQLINLLLIGRLDAAIMFDLVAQNKLQKMGVSDAIVPMYLNHSSDIYLAFSKLNPASPQLAQLLDEGLAKLKSKGQYESLLTVHD